MEGISDEGSPLHKLRSPNNVVKHVMPILWGYLTWKWQVGLDDHFLNYTLKIVSPINTSMPHFILGLRREPSIYVQKNLYDQGKDF